MTTPTAADIAAQIDTTTVAGHNLRAMLLRRLDGDAWRPDDGERDAYRAGRDLADALGLVDLDLLLTRLGREVAERLRPEPWHGEEMDSGVYLVRPNTSALQLRGALIGEVERIAALLTADDLRAAKAYKVGP